MNEKEVYEQIIIKLAAKLSKLDPETIRSIHFRYHNGEETDTGLPVYGTLDIAQMDNYQRLKILDIYVEFHLQREQEKK